METSIDAVGIDKVYWDGSRKLQILKDVSLSVKRGQGVAIWGPSGSGKTTLLNVLSGLDRPQAGQVILNGAGIYEMSENERAAFRNRHIGYVFQFYHLLPEFTALENALLPLLVRRERPVKEARERARELIERVGLKDRSTHFPSELSGGEQQRVAIARALSMGPDILFCDEPTGNLDPRMGADIVELLQRLFREEGKTVLIVTHDERIAKMMDRIWDILKGDWR